MVMPAISARMEEYGDLAGQRVDAGKVRPFLAIAEVAGQGQVVEVVGRDVLAGNDVLDMVSKFAVLLLEPAVLTAIPNSPTYALAEGLRSHAAKRRCAFNFSIVIKFAPSIKASYSAFSSGVSAPSFARFAK